MPQSFFPENDLGAGITEGFRLGTGFKPVLKQDLETAYKPYQEKFGQVKRADTDLMLYKRAVNKVIAWWKRQSKDEVPVGSAPPDGSAGVPPGSPGSGGAGGAGGSGGSGGAGGGSRGAMLPDTAMGRDPGKAPRLPDILTPAEQAARKAKQTAGANKVIGTTKGTPRVSDAAFRRILTQYRIPLNNTPPAYAMANETALRNWALRRRKAWDDAARARASVQRPAQMTRTRTVTTAPAPVRVSTPPPNIRQSREARY